MNLTEILTLCFIKPDDFLALSDNELESWFFMLNRQFSIKYPIEANHFNNIYINKADVLRCWCRIFARNKHTSIPDWIWTFKKKANKNTFYTKDNINNFCFIKNIGVHDFNFLIKHQEFKEQFEQFCDTLQ